MNVNTHAAQMNTKRLTGMGAVATLALELCTLHPRLDRDLLLTAAIVR